MPYTMVSPDGATYRTAADVTKREELALLGYTVVPAEKAPARAASRAKRTDKGGDSR